MNSDLVGKVVNLASRSAGFIGKNFAGQLAAQLPDQALFDEFAAAGESIAQAYEQREYGRATREVMALADKANQYFDVKKPWELIKNPETRPDVQAICTQGLNLFRALMIYLKPILPKMAADSEAFLNVAPFTWNDAATPLLAQTINRFKPLMQRVEEKQIAAIIEATKQLAATPVSGPLAKAPIAPEITINDFAKVDLRVARVVNAQAVENSAKLVQLTLDLGGETRNVFAGIKSSYAPEQLQDRLVIVVANLAHRKMRFGVSEGMVLAASTEDSGIFVLSPDSGAEPGMRVS